MKNEVFWAQSNVFFNSSKPQAVKFTMIKREASKPYKKGSCIQKKFDIFMFQKLCKICSFSLKTSYQEVIESYQKDIKCVFLLHCFIQRKPEPNKIIHSVVLKTFPCFLYQSLPIPLYVDSEHAADHYLWSTHLFYRNYLCFYLSSSVIPVLTQSKHKSCLSYVLMFLHNLGYPSQILHSDSTLWYISEAKISPDHWYLSKTGAGYDVAIYPGWKWRGWQVEIKPLRQGEDSECT